uniref:MICOS complex subunit MIC19 n=1 Tax=Hucho hucho TaxID=62062 RepID=A0A4W5REU2_9TELE
MGANNSTRRVSFESDENDNITVVKGIRLSENVINRMREPIAPLLPPSLPQVPPPVAAPSPLLIPVPALRPPFDPITSLPPIEPIALPPSPPVTEVVAPPPHPPPMEQVAAPTIIDMVIPPPTLAALKLVASPPPRAFDEEELRKKITEDLKKGLLKERAKAEQELQAWLEEEKVHAASFAEAEAQASVKYEVGRILELERATTHNTLTQAVMREKVSAEEERLRTQLYVKAQSDSDLEFICLSLVLSSSHFLFISLSLPPSPSLQIQITCHCVKWTPLWCTLMCNGCSDAHAVCLCACVCARVFVTEYVLSL